MEMDYDEIHEDEILDFYNEEIDRSIWNMSHDEPYESMWYGSESGKTNNDPAWV